MIVQGRVVKESKSRTYHIITIVEADSIGGADVYIT